MLAFPCYAAVYIVEPVDQMVLPVDSRVIFFGKIARGETLKVVIKKKNDLPSDWISFGVDQQGLPSGWEAESVETDKTLIALVRVPGNAAVSTQRISFTAGSAAGHAFDESFFATVSVHEKLLDASIENSSQNAGLGTEASFSLVLGNDSIAEHSVKVESTLPNYWFSSMNVQLNPHETKTVILPIIPFSYGEKNFSFTVSSTQNNVQFAFPAKLNVKPTLTGMFQAPVAGFPFFSPGMLSSYLINGLLSLFR